MGYHQQAEWVAGWNPFLVSRKIVVDELTSRQMRLQHVSLLSVQQWSQLTSSEIPWPTSCANGRGQPLFLSDDGGAPVCLPPSCSSPWCLTWLCVIMCVLYRSCIMSWEFTAGHLASVMFWTNAYPWVSRQSHIGYECIVWGVTQLSRAYWQLTCLSAISNIAGYGLFRGMMAPTGSGCGS